MRSSVPRCCQKAQKGLNPLKRTPISRTHILVGAMTSLPLNFKEKSREGEKYHPTYFFRSLLVLLGHKKNILM